MPTFSPVQSLSERLLTIQQAAQRLQVSDRTVRRLISTAKLPATRLGRLVRINPRDLRELERPL